MNNFTQQGCIKLITDQNSKDIDNKDIYNVKKDLYFKYMLFYWILHSSKNPEKKKTAVMKFAENSELHLK